ncbi:MAG: hypothetical protein DWQ02_20525 [Bacteroidetes bacterium]|nr:MAG: hypothetical protein DWQ02_20525 [Bacteroidota bacterium]
MNMFEKLHTRLIPVAQVRYILPGIFLILLFNFVFFPQGRNRLLEDNTLSGHLLDTKFSYGVDEAFDLMQSYGPEARTVYWKMALVVDNPYAVVYSLALMLLLILLFSATVPENSLLKVLSFVPLLAGLADIAENACLAYMLRSFPDISEDIIKLSSFFTSMKWIFLTGSLILLAWGTFKYFSSARPNHK